METVKLTSDFAEKVHEVESAVYPPQLIAGTATIRQNLLSAERDGENLSWGVVQDDTLVAYLLVWVASSLVEGREFEDVVFVEDVALLPGYQKAFFLLFSALSDDLEKHNLRSLPIEGVSRVEAFKVFSRHEKIFKSLGYQIVASHEYYDEELGEHMIWNRFEPVEAPMVQEEKSGG